MRIRFCIPRMWDSFSRASQTRRAERAQELADISLEALWRDRVQRNIAARQNREAIRYINRRAA